jgi:hypothetical protein
MSDYTGLQKVLVGKSERIYREYRDALNALTTPTSPYVRIYNPIGAIVSSSTPTAESTGVYYHALTVADTAGVLEGIYQAYWEGTIGGSLITMDTPQFLHVFKHPWQASQQDSLAQSVRRLIGDTNPNNYRISIEDMYYFIKDAVDDVQSRYEFGYTLVVSPTALTWNQSLTTVPTALFKLRALILVLKSTFHDLLYDGGSVQVGDIKVDVTNVLKIRRDNIDKLEKEYEQLMHEIKLNGCSGVNIDTYVTGIIMNSVNESYWVYEL